eukprot:CAMPEP_0184482996 /NCGR_PEP_ID=MMETSP0113_2-20130426/4599_1 /TAXON_ID=91329 /ORGANISM="Norrisiella sphaerica, Strain BC52" /LENGTH=324 /DNA_ID=CAMNT_0026863095 /DNA_START=180 /DNA_END=1154 /DNA_ORIENTATION=-
MKFRDAKKAYENSILDSRRQHPTRDELLQFEWRFRFKESAGTHWMQIDPYWAHDHKGSKFASTIVRKFDPNGTLRRLDNFEALRSFSEYNNDFKWAVKETSSDGKLIKRIQVNHFPSYVSSRHPKNWGFIMQSCWVLWTSFPMPARGQDELLDDNHLAVNVDDQMEEVHRYNFGGHRGAGVVDRVMIETTNGPMIIPFSQLARHLSTFEYHSDDSDDDEDDDDYVDEDDDDDSHDDDDEVHEEGGKAEMNLCMETGEEGRNGIERMEDEDDADDSSDDHEAFPDSTTMGMSLQQAISASHASRQQPAFSESKEADRTSTGSGKG